MSLHPATLSLLLTALVVLVCGSCSQPRSAPESGPPDAPKAKAAPGEAKEQRGPRLGQLTLKGSTVTGADPRGNVLWRAQAERVEFDEEAEEASLLTVDCTFLESGEPVSRYEAGKMTAHFGEADRRLHFSDAVHAQSLVSQTTAEFDQATYLWDEKRLIDARPVSLARGTTRITGDRLEADVALRRVQVYGRPGLLSLFGK